MSEVDAEGVWYVSATGALDFATADAAQRLLEQPPPAGCRHIVLDLSALIRLDLTGLAAVLDLFLRTEGSGTRLSVVSNQEPVTRVLRSTGLDDILGVVGSRAEATRQASASRA